MSKHHEIYVEDFVEWLNDAKIMYASSSRERKRLFADTKGNLEITVADVPVWSGTSPEEAVLKYNSICDPYHYPLPLNR